MSKTLQDQQFWITIFYEGPWERLSSFLLGIRRDNRDALRWEIPDNPKGWRKALGNLANWTDQRDQRWRYKYAIRRKCPPKVWKR